MVYQNICLTYQRVIINTIYTHTTEDIRFYCRTDIFKYYYFPATTLKWNKFDVKLRQSEFLPHFRNALLHL